MKEFLMKLYYKILFICFGLLLITCEANVRKQGIKVPERYGASEYSNLSEQAKRRFLRENYFYTDMVIDAIINEEVFAGMTTDMALFSWGQPDEIEQRSGTWGSVEKWTYGVTSQGEGFKYLHFKNGRLDEWRD
jgi:hypothetical protein